MVKCKEKRPWKKNQVGQKFQNRLLAIEEMHLGDRVWQDTVVARVVEAMEEEHQVLETCQSPSCYLLPGH